MCDSADDRKPCTHLWQPLIESFYLHIPSAPPVTPTPLPVAATTTITTASTGIAAIPTTTSSAVAIGAPPSSSISVRVDSLAVINHWLAMPLLSSSSPILASQITYDHSMVAAAPHTKNILSIMDTYREKERSLMATMNQGVHMIVPSEWYDAMAAQHSKSLPATVRRVAPYGI